MLRQIAPLSNLVFNIFSAVPTSKTSFQIAAECTIQQPRFKTFLSSSNFRKHRINSISMHQLVSLISKVSAYFQLPKNHFKYRQKAPVQLASLFSKVSPQSQPPKHRFKQCKNALFMSLISKFSQLFQLFLNKKFRRGDTQPDHFPISSKLYFAHATPLVTYLQPRGLKLPNILDSDDKC